MLFNSLTFLLFHLILVGLYWAVKSQVARQIILLTGSVVFYGWYYWPALILLGISMLINYGFSRWIDSAGEEKKKKALSFWKGKSLTDRRFLRWGLVRQVSTCAVLLLLILAFAEARLDFIYFVF